MVIKVFDFFSGCGGTSKGFESAGMDIIWAIDNDSNAGETFQRNFPEAHFENEDVLDLPTECLEEHIAQCQNQPILFSGCAPCQPYSRQNKQNNPDDERRTLLNQFRRFVEFYEPEYVFVENVPGMQNIDPDVNSPFGQFLAMLDAHGYSYKTEIIYAQNYGVPQKRRRLVLIASNLGDIDFPNKTHGNDEDLQDYSNIGEWIRDYPPIEAGEEHAEIPNHKAAGLRPINLERLRHTPMGGDRRDWPERLILDCHINYSGHTDVYGRMSWDSLSNCLTTRCTSISNGRYGHPDQHRAISAREAASLQTFPRDFVFSGGIGAIARQVGNAVPVLLANHFGENFINHYEDYLIRGDNG